MVARNYKKGKKHGLYEDFIGGCISRVKTYEYGEKILEESYDHKNCSTVVSNLQSKIRYKDSEPHGEYIHFNSGEISSVFCYFNGEWSDYKSISNFDDDKRSLVDTHSESVLDGTYCEN